MSFSPKRKFKNKRGGFTLVELLVTITIFVILTGVVLFSQAKFNGTILLTNLAYDTALTIRQAQTYGINIKNFVNDSGNNFVPYGVHFDLKEGNNKSFILFADLDENGVFEGDPTSCNPADGCVYRYSIKRGNYIEKLYINDAANPGQFIEVPEPDYSLDLVFTRPNPDAKITTAENIFSIAKIVLGNPNDDNVREVVVQENGLIYIASR